MKFQSFSPKQKQVLNWWCPSSPNRNLEGILCDGAVRSGKTFCMGLSFFCWAMATFNGQRFGICGATKASVERNILFETVPALEMLGLDEDMIHTDYTSVGGWVTDVMEHIPESGETAESGIFRITAAQVNEQTVEKVIIELLPAVMRQEIGKWHMGLVRKKKKEKKKRKERMNKKKKEKRK